MNGIDESKFIETHEPSIGISPVLLKNLNLYETLEPQKISTSSPGINEHLLIDFESPVELNRAVGNEDKGFNVIDAFQNIYVSPELVKNETKTKPQTDVDYEDFFRKVEFKKYIDMTQTSQIAEPKNSIFDVGFTFVNSEPLKQCLPINNDLDNDSFNINTITSYDNETDAYQEDLIYEVLLDRTLEKQKARDVKSEESANNYRVQSALKISNNTSQICNVIDLIPKEGFTKTQNRTTNIFHYIDNNQNSPNNKTKKPPEFSNHSASSSTNDTAKSANSALYNPNIAKNNAKLDIKQINDLHSYYLKKFKTDLIDSESKSYITDLTKLRQLVVNPGEMKEIPVQAAIKDPKEYSKNRAINSNIEKRNYTKGPDFNEKRLVLPQLLNRLSVQKNHHNVKKNAKKRPILYADSVRTDQGKATVELNPTILMEDCNRERLIAFKTRQELLNFVQNGNIL